MLRITAIPLLWLSEFLLRTEQRQELSRARLRKDNKQRKICRCVDCYDDNDCGGLWSGRATHIDGSFDADAAFDSVTFVISHCSMSDFRWIEDFIGDTIERSKIKNVEILSKCKKKVFKTPPEAKVTRLLNVGRSDHSYAFYMDHIYDPNNLSNDAFVFMKDTREKVHQPLSLRSLKDMLRLTHKRGFACGYARYVVEDAKKDYYGFSISEFHHTTALLDFTMFEYAVRSKDFQESIGEGRYEFVSDYANLKAFMKDVNYSFPQRLTPVCYGGMFATTRRAIQRQPKELWEKLEDSLARGSIIEEGYFMERSWAGLLADPLPDYQLRALERHAFGKMNEIGTIVGALKGQVSIWDKKQRSAFSRYRMYIVWSIWISIWILIGCSSFLSIFLFLSKASTNSTMKKYCPGGLRKAERKLKSILLKILRPKKPSELLLLKSHDK